jgi:hypothetical protein
MPTTKRFFTPTQSPPHPIEMGRPDTAASSSSKGQWPLEQKTYGSMAITHPKRPGTSTGDMMRTMQMDFAACRAMMLDIQSRLSLLENGKEIAAPGHARSTYQGDAWQVTEYRPSTSRHAPGSHVDAFVTANDFLGLPRRFSGFRFDFDIDDSAGSTAQQSDHVRKVDSTSGREGCSDGGGHAAGPRYSVFPQSTKHEPMFEMRRAYARRDSPPQSDQDTEPRALEMRGRAHTIASFTPTWKLDTEGRGSGMQNNITREAVEVEGNERPRMPPSSRSLGGAVTALPALPDLPASPPAEATSHRRAKSMRSFLGSRASFKRSRSVRA